MIKKAIIPAAGYGTRSLPITKVLPKEMFPIKGKPSIHYIVEEAVESGIEEILIIVSKYKNLIVDYFDVSLELEAFLESRNKAYLLDKLVLPKVHIQYTRQPYARGLGDAILLGRSFAGNDPFAVLLPDDIIINQGANATKQLIDLYNTVESPVIALKYMKDELLHKYGVVDITSQEGQVHHLKSIIEKPKHSPPSNLAVVGRYIMTPDIFDCITVKSGEFGEEIQLTDAICKLMANRACYGYEIEGDRFDIGIEEEYLQLIRYIHGLENPI
ncbi:UTP--glucose-1-phosphate uridylyltransferase [Pseudalkalibacillus salsuginis]|uniref:UTP--glucose-1-phosphate uridylyltransferase n=1 Tax=Pseudalkalibacillus salsuginis TaxID=2910972 RepID=UPI001F3FE075|nr:UTP--glucose-1-phosphate uridylyltransferase [Pseudalkalibacillus salsuginis]MCF6409144.1 UTP--glucose-1-phosphate uridylyltransferase [Pseudalkalibacillus salsuginis]